MSDKRKRARDIDKDYINILDEVTGLPISLKNSQDNIKLLELRNNLYHKHVSYEMIIKLNISIDKKIELLSIKTHLNNLLDENGTKHIYFAKYLELWNLYSENLKISQSPSLKPEYQTIDYDIHNPINEYLKRLDNINLDFSKKTIIYGKIMHLSVCSQDEESNNLRVWLDYVTTYPWNIIHSTNITKMVSMTDLQKEIEKLKENVNKEIYGMNKAKDEMLRYYVDFKMGHKSVYTVALCGPPGVGKTIFFQVFAKYIKIPFKLIHGGCITDVGCIQGGLKMYIGAGAGCITDAIHEAKQEDILIVFDELDKIYDNMNPMAIMNQINHVVDRSSNHTFVDNYMSSNLPVNYSKCLFGATLNDKSKLSNITDNRLLIIDLEGYTLNEKILIAKQYVVPKMIEQSIFKKENNIDIVIDDDNIKYIIEKKIQYEPGIRKLEHIFKQLISKLQYSKITNGLLKMNEIKIIIDRKMIDKFI